MLKALPFLAVCSCLTSHPSGRPTPSPTAVPGKCFSKSELDYIYAFVGPPVDRPTEPIIIDLGDWFTSLLSGNVAAILLKEVLGYNVSTVKFASSQNPDIVVDRLMKNASDMNFEVWLSKDGPGQFRPSIQRFLDKALVYSAGPLGATGTQGWFVPTSLVKEMLIESVDMDFWRTYSPQRATSSEAYSALNKGGRVNDSDWVAPPFIPISCMFTNSSSNIQDCTEIIALTPEWGEGALPQIIVNNQFRFQVAYVGDRIDELVLERVNDKRSVIFYSWTPTRFMTNYGSMFTRIALPPFTEACYGNNTRDPRGAGSVDCDYPPVPIYKMYSKRLHALSEIKSSTQQNEFADLIRMLKAFSLATSDLEWMVSRLNSEEDVFETACAWLKACTNKPTPAPSAVYTSLSPSSSSASTPFSSPLLFSSAPAAPSPLPFPSPRPTASPTTSPTIPPTPFPGLLTCDWFGWIHNTPMNYVEGLNPFYVAICTSVAGVVAGVSVLMQLMLCKHREHPLIRATAPRLCHVMLIGSYLGCAAVVVSAQGQRYRPYCILFPTLFGCAFVLVFGSLTLKNRRIHQIFNRAAHSKGGPPPVKPASDAKLIQSIAALVGCELMLNMLYFAFNAPQVDLIASSDRAMHWNCLYEEKAVYVVLYVTPKALLVMYAMWVSWQVRNVHDQFNESPKLAFSAYTTVIFGGLGLGIGVSEILPDNEMFLINSMLILVGILSNVLVIFVPKLWAIYYLPSSPTFDAARWSPSRSSTTDDAQVNRLKRRLVDSTRQIEQLKRMLKDNGLEIPLLSSVADSQSRNTQTR